ncbi:hypothetical protein [Nocardiopsis alba]|nr:hypothetical protein [Nocardiopsis alba]
MLKQMKPVRFLKRDSVVSTALKVLSTLKVWWGWTVADLLFGGIGDRG